MLNNYKKITKKYARELLEGKKVINPLCIWINNNNKDANIRVVNNLENNDCYKVFVKDNQDKYKIVSLKSNCIVFKKQNGENSYLYHRKGEEWYLNNNTIVYLKYNDNKELITILVYELV